MSTRRTRTQEELAREVCEYIADDPGRRLTIEHIAEHFGVSATLLKTSFRSARGITVYTYVRAQRMEKAAKLLRETDRTVLDIAGECGYDNGSKFSKAFSLVMGTTPSKYRSL